MKCFYHNDMDGRCAAAMVHSWVGVRDMLAPVEFIEMDYARTVDLKTIRPQEQIWIVDFSFKPEVMVQILAITQDVTWIDHHGTAIDAYDKNNLMSSLRGVRRVGESGSLLTWKYIHWYTARGNGPIVMRDDAPEGLEAPDVVRLVNDYDIWARKIKESNAFMEGVKLRKHGPEDEFWFDLWSEHGFDGRIQNIIHDGEIAAQYRTMYCDEINTSFGFECEIEGHRSWVCNVYKFGSLAYGDRIMQYDICVGCIFDGVKWTVSLYSEKADIDVSVICKKHGGGGHKGAAGFVCNELPFKKGGTK